MREGEERRRGRERERRKGPRVYIQHTPTHTHMGGM